MKKEVEILITGDFYGGKRVEDMIQKRNYNHIFNDLLPVIRNADIAITNLEAPLIRNGKQIEKTGPALKNIPETIDALNYAGFNLLTLANNHIMDYGEDGLINTMDLCSGHGIAIVGAGKSFKFASHTYFREINSYKIAIVNIAENEWSTTEAEKAGAHPMNLVTNFYSIQEAKKSADFVFVIVHGGHETYQLPSPRMKQTYRFFIDAGANAVIGHHTHCFSGYEIYKNAPIFYSLGNFIFDNENSKELHWHYGFAVKFVIINNILNYEIIPYEQCKQTVGVILLQGELKTLFFEELEKLNTLILDDEYLKETFKKFVNKLSKSYNALLEPHSFKLIRFLQSRGLIPSMLTTRKRKLYLNLIRCEAHRDIILEILNDDSNT